ncbi:hypothetical protein [Xenorhabdus bovienii]|uniref:hypothetical protein n=1 Tax=Xenorhabdus bovienii TaxID=40576 RepID=UPI0023B326D0|nr:hypothetical protein [Xenorhabdus bovienii]MDE9553580.1 hypothetical protein [Xenorhabdus bovienii]
MKDIDYMKLLAKDVCPICGKKDCNLIKHESVINKLVEAYFKGDMLTVKKMSIQRIAPYFGVLNSIFSEVLEKDTSMSSIGLWNHYKTDTGQEITLSQIGVHDKVLNLIQTPGAFKRPGNTSIQSRFISQIQNGERISFKNAYDFGTESRSILDPLWAIGGAVVSGKLTDIEVTPRGDYYNLSGVVNYSLYDKYGDPIDIFNWFEKDWDPFGTPFEIKGEWKQTVTIDVDKNVYENQIKPLIDKQ